MHGSVHHPLLQAILREVLVQLERTPDAQATANLVSNALEGDVDRYYPPQGEEGYRHVCILDDGTRISIKRFRGHQSQGHQIEIEHRGHAIRVPSEADDVINLEPSNVVDLEQQIADTARRIAPLVVHAILELTGAP